MKRTTGLIPALDVETAHEALRLVDQLKGLVDAYKVNYPLVLRGGLRVVSRLAEHGYILCDFKVSDIPDIDEKIVRLAFDAGASGVIVHGFMGSDAMKACVGAGDGEIFVVAELSHPGGSEFMAPVAEEIAQKAMTAGARGIIAPATRPARISALRKIVGKGLILSPGVGAQGGAAREAIRAGTDHVIVGRAIYEARDPRKAAEGFVEDIRAA